MNPDRHPMTVAELIAALQELDPNKLVDLEGCDCAGSLVSVVDEDEVVYLRRAE